MVALAGKGPLVKDSEEVETLASRKAVEFAMEVGFRDIILEGDNVNVIRFILIPRSNKARLGFVYEDIQCLGKGV